jgi:hypothetical protein
MFLGCLFGLVLAGAASLICQHHFGAREAAQTQADAVSVQSPSPFDARQAAIERSILSLKSRLNLTSGQEIAVNTAMEGMLNFRPGAKTVDQTMKEILDPEQKIAWEQIKEASMESSARSLAQRQVNDVDTTLPLGLTQEEQLRAAFYRAALDDLRQGSGIRIRTREDVLAKVLSPDQLTTYHRRILDRLQIAKLDLRASVPGVTTETIRY